MAVPILAGSKRAIALIALFVAVAAAIGAFTGQRIGLAASIRQVGLDARMRTEFLRSELERHRLLPAALAGDSALASALAVSTGTVERPAVELDALNRRLEELSRYDGAATLYLIGSDGITRAASNFSTSRSFVGQDYSGRSYFRDAMQRGFGQLFANGTVSGVPGLYLAQRLASGTGVIVVKIEFGALEASWIRDGELTVVTDESGRVILTSVPALRFDAAPGSPALDTVSASLAMENGWTLRMDRAVDGPLLRDALVGATLGGLLAALLGLGIERVRARNVERTRVQVALREEVARRTAELREANDLLLKEIDERNRSDAQIQKLRNDLINANKLAVLGQISAGVAHEINQPVAAIRSYVDSAQVLLERRLLSEVGENLEVVSSLTERIGVITGELRTFSRQEPAAAEPVRLADAIDGALALVRPLLRAATIVLQRDDTDPALVVRANRIRLEQVLMNLLQNASEAVSGSPAPQVRVRSGPADGTGGGWIDIDDNGPGIPEERMAQLFTPFATTKPRGLGLGLVICRDILSQYGGALEYRRSDLGGASFRIRLVA